METLRKQYHFWPSPRGLQAWDVHRLIELTSDLPRIRDRDASALDLEKPLRPLKVSDEQLDRLGVTGPPQVVGEIFELCAELVRGDGVHESL